MPTHKQPLETVVLAQLRTDITKGFFKSGAHLAEAKLSARYNVSRTPVREALSQLTAEGLIITKPNRGAFVAPHTTEAVAHTKTVYSTLVALTVHTLTDAAADELAQFIKNTLPAAEISPTFEKVRKEIHQKITQANTNILLSQLIPQLEARLPKPLFTPAKTTAEVQIIHQNYLYLSAALMRKKLEAAEKTLRTLVELQTAPSPTQKTASSAQNPAGLTSV